MNGRKLPVRWRLTLVYGSLLFVTTGVLMVINYLMVRQILTQRFLIKLPPTHKALIGTAGPPRPNVLFIQSIVEDEVGRYVDVVTSSLVQWSILATVLIGLVGLAIGWVLAGRALAPLLTMTETARRLSDSTLHQRISMDGPRDEIKDLADTFDSMLERLDQAFDTQRRFVANASHELKTPLAINRALLQVGFADPVVPRALRPIRDELLAANSRQEQLIEGLLTLAHSERELTTRQPVDLRDLAHPALLAHHLPRPRSWRPAPCAGDAVLLERMIANLVDNAVKYNDERGEVTVRTGSDATTAFITVENTGRQIAPAQIPALFEPFRRLDADRTGSATGAGLGLSIVRAVTRAHSGTVTATPLEKGGLRITVNLPLARPSLDQGSRQPTDQAHLPARTQTQKALSPVPDNA
ncbi:ATP-binding protein [Acrocarpospora macrocephala]|uniref:histidine kinase n=1 Tax=Acrocarpospora macrocephala TaxID=150177 RepID=A0A5M3XCW7_9ACTN|nr:HAMP domain-containing sensor histidine kinase [Acrocarpospora macrocephala]GES16733.1 two-component sensor histidine kinase [Acrocarpospora macrocephala]